MACSGCELDKPIQNKKYNLCSDCVFKKSHGGKSKQEVYQERADKKPKKEIKFKQRVIMTPTSYVLKKSDLSFDESVKGRYVQDEESRQNEINQNLAELEARREAKKNGEIFELDDFEEKNLINRVEKVNKLFPKKKKQKALKPQSLKQQIIEASYKATCVDMDHTTEPLCTGCGKYQGGDIRLSHSHLISRADCQRIGKPELISERDNLTYHCISFGNNVLGCHNKWENPSERESLLDYEDNIKYIKSVSPEMYIKYTSKK